MAGQAECFNAVQTLAKRLAVWGGRHGIITVGETGQQHARRHNVAAAMTCLDRTVPASRR